MVTFTDKVATTHLGSDPQLLTSTNTMAYARHYRSVRYNHGLHKHMHHEASTATIPTHRDPITESAHPVWIWSQDVEQCSKVPTYLNGFHCKVDTASTQLAHMLLEHWPDAAELLFEAFLARVSTHYILMGCQSDRVAFVPAFVPCAKVYWCIL